MTQMTLMDLWMLMLQLAGKVKVMDVLVVVLISGLSAAALTIAYTAAFFLWLDADDDSKSSNGGN